MPYGNQQNYGQPYGAQNQTGYFQGPDKDCETLHYAMKGLGTDERTIINLICSRNAMQRAEIRRKYVAMYGTDLIKKLKDELSGNFEDTVVGLFMTPPEYDAYCLYKAMKGIGTSEGILIEILASIMNLIRSLVGETSKCSRTFIGTGLRVLSRKRQRGYPLLRPIPSLTLSNWPRLLCL
jgi:hypothetical protein